MSMLFKRIKDWAVSIASFRNGDVIPVDGPSGTAKMPYSDLAKEVIKDSANNTAATEADMTADAKLPIMTTGGPKALPANLVAKQSSVVALQTKTGNISVSIAPEYNETTGAVDGNFYMHEGVLYRCKEDVSGDWDATKFTEIPLSYYLGMGFYQDKFLLGTCYFNLLNLEDTDVALGKYLNVGGALGTSDSYNTTGFIPVVGGVEYEIGPVTYGEQAARAMCCYDENKNYLSYTNYPSTFTLDANVAYIRVTITTQIWNTQMIAPKACLPSSFLEYGKFKFNSKFIFDKDVVKFSEIEGLLDILQCKFIEYNLLNLSDSDVEIGKYLNAGGNMWSNSAYNTTGFIPVSEGVEYKTTKIYRASLCYDGSKNLISGSYTENTNTRTPPRGAKYMRFTFYATAWDTVMVAPTMMLPSIYFPYGKIQIKKSVLPSDPEPTEVPAKMNGFRASNDSLAVDTNLSITGFHIAKNSFIAARIKGSLTKVSVGVAYLGYYGYWAEITPTQVVVKHGTSGDVVQTLTHDLTLDDDLSVSIDRTMNVDGTETTNLRMVTQKGGIYEHTLSWGISPGSVFVRNQNDSGTLDCSISFMPKDAGRRIWLFGDSYMGYTDPARWPYYLINQLHFTSFLLDARGGEGASEALTDFNTLMNNHAVKPSFAVWLHGMNGGNDATSGPNATWLEKTQTFISSCVAAGITPILATIPTVPNKSHVYLNAWVRSSGYRYIDFAIAVEQEGTTTWKYHGETEQYLSSDNEHPTAYGAKALCEQVLKDFPEISIL